MYRKKEDKKTSIPETVGKETSKSNTNHNNNEKVNNTLITLDNSVANSSTNLDKGIALDKFQNELFQSSVIKWSISDLACDK